MAKVNDIKIYKEYRSEDLLNRIIQYVKGKNLKGEDSLLKSSVGAELKNSDTIVFKVPEGANTITVTANFLFSKDELKIAFEAKLFGFGPFVKKALNRSIENLSKRIEIPILKKDVLTNEQKLLIEKDKEKQLGKNLQKAKKLIDIYTDKFEGISQFDMNSWIKISSSFVGGLVSAFVSKDLGNEKADHLIKIKPRYVEKDEEGIYACSIVLNYTGHQWLNFGSGKMIFLADGEKFVFLPSENRKEGDGRTRDMVDETISYSTNYTDFKKLLTSKEISVQIQAKELKVEKDLKETEVEELNEYFLYLFEIEGKIAKIDPNNI